METIRNCPRSGDNCSLCVSLAQEEFGNQLSGGGFDKTDTKLYTEDAKLPLLVEEVTGVDVLSCDDRRSRARLIGRKAGEAFVYRSNAPGDIE